MIYHPSKLAPQMHSSIMFHQSQLLRRNEFFFQNHQVSRLSRCFFSGGGGRYFKEITPCIEDEHDGGMSSRGNEGIGAKSCIVWVGKKPLTFAFLAGIFHL